MKRKLLFGLLVFMLVVLPLCSACAEPAAPEQKTLKIGGVFNLGWSAGLDTLRGIELMVDEDNKNGGLEIGGERYNVELIAYDSNGNQATEVAAVNRLVFEDKVKFILSDGMFTAAWIATTEENKVLTFTCPADFRVNLSPDTHYSCNPSTIYTTIRVATGWFCENYPDLAESILTARPDNQIGHITTKVVEPVFKAFGVTPLVEFYPESATDLSALGTKVKTRNPTAFGSGGGGVLQDALAFKAVHQAGYKGQLFSAVGAITSTYVGAAGAEALEGFICPGGPLEFDPPLTQVAQEYKDAWIAKYGTWDGGDSSDPSFYICLRTALQQAGSLDVDEVAAVIFNGMKFESTGGVINMMSRPDIGNERTVNAIGTVYMKQIKGGKNTLTATIDVDEGMKYVQKAWAYLAGSE